MAKTVSSHTKTATKVIRCNCDSEYQDKNYGIGMRLHNPNKNGYKCTVCGKPVNR